MSEILTLREVAELLRVHPNTVYRLARSGKLPAFKAGTDWRFARRDVEAWMRNRGESASPSLEDDVVHVVYWMLSQGFSLSVPTSSLAELLDCSPRSVQRAVSSLRRQGLVSTSGDRVALTPDGTSEAQRRHAARGQPPSGHDSVRLFAERQVGLT